MRLPLVKYRLPSDRDIRFLSIMNTLCSLQHDIDDKAHDFHDRLLDLENCPEGSDYNILEEFVTLVKGAPLGGPMFKDFVMFSSFLPDLDSSLATCVESGRWLWYLLSLGSKEVAKVDVYIQLENLLRRYAPLLPEEVRRDVPVPDVFKDAPGYVDRKIVLEGYESINFEETRMGRALTWSVSDILDWNSRREDFRLEHLTWNEWLSVDENFRKGSVNAEDEVADEKLNEVDIASTI